MKSHDPSLLLLHERDNVFTLIHPVKAGDLLSIENVAYTVLKGLPIGHKIAATEINTGEKIIKYGVPIGSASERISTGDHVHTHNLRSDYLPTFTLDGSNVFLKNA